uniref:Putative secreted protein n=1 Tax=Anopheles darlingi TaxID=43151 RepID=A0A2M4DEP5_ANODA
MWGRCMRRWSSLSVSDLIFLNFSLTARVCGAPLVFGGDISRFGVRVRVCGLRCVCVFWSFRSGFSGSSFTAPRRTLNGRRHGRHGRS